MVAYTYNFKQGKDLFIYALAGLQLISYIFRGFDPTNAQWEAL